MVKEILKEWKGILTDFEKELLNKSYEYFKKKEEWPKSLKLYVKLRKKGNIYKSAEEIGDKFIRVGNPDSNESVCRLTIFGIALCDGSENDIENFMKALKMAVKNFIKNPLDAKLTSKEIKKELSLSDQDLKLLCEIIHEGHIIWGGASYDKEKIEYTFDIRHHILKYENIKSFEDLIKLEIDRIPPRFGGKQKPYIPGRPFWPEKEYEVTKEIREVEEGYVFILMPMDDEYLLNQVNLKVREICNKFDLKAERVDDIQSSGNITDEILECIDKAEFIVTDLSMEKPNVYYELGYAHGTGFDPYELILIAKKGTELHFDIRNYRVIYYKDPDDLEKKLINRFQALFDTRKEISE